MVFIKKRFISAEAGRLCLVLVDPGLFVIADCMYNAGWILHKCFSIKFLMFFTAVKMILCDQKI